MINEYAYCPRLFYLEWVQGQFEHNQDTVEGRFLHRVVDAGGGQMGRSPHARAARSVELSSRRLGLIAKADIIESKDGAVIPVEVKRGRPPKHGPAWMPEKVQLCTIGILLNENGYESTEGQIYFAKTRRRVTIPFDNTLVSHTLNLVEELREVARSPEPPAPLVDSPKCPRCSLVGICLPDEINVNCGRLETSTIRRRLTPRDSAARPLYVTEQGARIGVRSGRVVVRKHKEELEQIRLIDVSQIAIYGNVQISSQMMRAAFRSEIPVCWFSYGGWFQGIAEGLPSKHVELRRRQAAIAAQAGLPIARSMIQGKIRNSRTILMRNSRENVKTTTDQLKQMAQKTDEIESVESLLGLEGAAARLYFSKFSSMLSNASISDFDYRGRNRRPPRDLTNCLLSFVYALLVKDLTAAAFAVGLDPYLGVYHRPRFGRPALALDLAEEFRPLIAESVVLTVINNGEVRPSLFIRRAGAVSMTKGCRRSVIAAYERRMDTHVTHPTYGYRITYRRVLEVQARVLAAHLMREVPDYVPFMTR